MSASTDISIIGTSSSDTSTYETSLEHGQRPSTHLTTLRFTFFYLMRRRGEEKPRLFWKAKHSKHCLSVGIGRRFSTGAVERIPCLLLWANYY